MRLHQNSTQYQETGTFALRMLWIPIVISVLVVGFLATRTPRDAPGLAIAAAPAQAAATIERSVSPEDPLSQLMYGPPVSSEEALAAQQLLDPVGAGHDVAR